MRCHCGTILFWDVQRSYTAETPTVFLLTTCVGCGEEKRTVLDVLWPPPPPDPALEGRDGTPAVDQISRE